MAPGPRAVVIPFGVPAEGRGLGLGLAALVHSFAQIDGHSVALAQLLARRPEDSDTGAPAPVEAFVPPNAWRDLAGESNGSSDVGVVVTGAFEPPTEGAGGLIQLLAFDARDGSTRARVESPFDGEHAGRAVLRAFEELLSRVGGELGVVKDIGDLGWDALESVLRAERCALHDPTRGGPHDRLAAMLHLGRAVGDAPDARFPAGRLAALALDTALATPADTKLADAALRALTRAADDAPGQIDLLEATAALHLKLGDADRAVECVERALEHSPDRMRLYALLSEARRAKNDLPGALAAIETGLRARPDDPVLRTEYGVVLAEQGNGVAAMGTWQQVLAGSLHPPAFTNLAMMLSKGSDPLAAQALVDRALAAPAPHPEVLRRAIQLALLHETDGIARASRVAKLAQALVERAPEDAWGSLMLARSLAQMGDRKAAAERLADVERIAPQSAMASEAQRGKFTLEEPRAAQELEAVLRAAFNADQADLGVIAARGRKLAMTHSVWLAWYAVGIAERRREGWPAARQAFEAALELSPGCTPAHTELVAVCVSLDDTKAALEHAQRAMLLEGETPRSFAVLATALLAAGKQDEAQRAIDRSLALDDKDEAHRALAERIRSGSAPAAGPLSRVRDAMARWFKR